MAKKAKPTPVKPKPRSKGAQSKPVKRAAKRVKAADEFVPVDRAGRRLDDPDRFKKPGMIQPRPKKSWWQVIKEIFK